MAADSSLRQEAEVEFPVSFEVADPVIFSAAIDQNLLAGLRAQYSGRNWQGYRIIEVVSVKSRSECFLSLVGKAYVCAQMVCRVWKLCPGDVLVGVRVESKTPFLRGKDPSGGIVICNHQVDAKVGDLLIVKVLQASYPPTGEAYSLLATLYKAPPPRRYVITESSERRRNQRPNSDLNKAVSRELEMIDHARAVLSSLDQNIVEFFDKLLRPLPDHGAKVDDIVDDDDVTVKDLAEAARTYEAHGIWQDSVKAYATFTGNMSRKPPPETSDESTSVLLALTELRIRTVALCNMVETFHNKQIIADHIHLFTAMRSL